MALWVFGYGSLLHRPGFSFEERRTAALGGRARRFWQGSPDHRGTPERPGRVVTLVDLPGERAVGAAFRVRAGDEDGVLAALDHREQAGYERLFVRADTAEGSLEVLTYRAPPGNPSWLGPAPELEIARHVASSRGPSGTNAAYVFALADVLRGEGVDDPHVFAIERALAALGASR